MSKPSWVEKVSGKSRWIRATKLEEEGKFEEAAKLYVEEAENCSEERPAMAGLSFLSAAKSLLKAGKRREAMELFERAARNYMRHAETVKPISPHTAAWSYRMASKCYAWAEMYEESREAKRIADSITEKVEGVEEYPLFKVFKPKKRSGSR